VKNCVPINPSPYIFSICNDKLAWDSLVNESPQGHVFSQSSFLESLDVPYKCYVVTTPQGQLLAGVAILHKESKMLRAPFEFTPYLGIIYSNYISCLGQQKRLTAEFRITSFIIDALLSAYSNFSMAMSPFFKDLRPFLWHNFGKENLPIFSIRQRYTGHLSLNYFNLENYLSSVRTVRRQEFHKSSATIDQTTDIGTLLKIYEKTFSRQNIDLDKLTLLRVKSICEAAIIGGYGYLVSAKVEGQIASMAFFLKDKDSAYYLLGANEPNLRFANASSKLLINCIDNFSKEGVKRFDFVGVNSPQRGDFKLSFNAELIPYQEVHLVNHE
jgi:Acetyltransferase (GNAT) domain